MRWLAWTWGLGVLFLVIQGVEWTRLVHFGLRVSSGIYGATFYTLIGVHGAHVLGAAAWLGGVLWLAGRGRFTPRPARGARVLRDLLAFRRGPVAGPVRARLPRMTAGKESGIVSDAAAALHHPAVEPVESPLTPESWGKLGMWIFLAGDAVGFGVLLASYGAMRAGSVDWPNPAQVLGIQLTALMTFLLICSSVTMVKALEKLRKGDRARAKMFVLLTALGGAIFVGLQAYEWTHLIHRGLRSSATPGGPRCSGRPSSSSPASTACT